MTAILRSEAWRASERASTLGIEREASMRRFQEKLMAGGRAPNRVVRRFSDDGPCFGGSVRRHTIYVYAAIVSRTQLGMYVARFAEMASVGVIMCCRHPWSTHVVVVIPPARARSVCRSAIVPNFCCQRPFVAVSLLVHVRVRLTDEREKSDCSSVRPAGRPSVGSWTLFCSVCPPVPRLCMPFWLTHAPSPAGRAAGRAPSYGHIVT